MAEGALTPADLTAIITRIRLQPDSALAAGGQLDVLLARVSALTDALRGSQPNGTVPNQTVALAARLLLADLGLATAYLRADASAVREALTPLLDALQVELDRVVS
jgi:hypothetical protein